MHNKEKKKYEPVYTGRGAAEILFLSNSALHMAYLNLKVLGRSTLVGAILPGCRECW